MKKIIFVIIMLIPLVLSAWNVKIDVAGELPLDTNIGQLRSNLISAISNSLNDSEYKLYVNLEEENLRCKVDIIGNRDSIENFNSQVENYFNNVFGENYSLSIQYSIKIK